MLYTILKIPAQLVFWFYCRHLSVNKPALFKSNGPLLIAANHPNSFLDAVILATLFKRPVYSLARGDAFANKYHNKILRATKILPVYRISEGAHNLGHNYTTFDACKDIFRQNGIVLIFSEGLCVNEWHLRPLKKGTARLALSCWQDGIPLKVLPLGINYSTFCSFGKNVQLNFGDFIPQQEMITQANFGQIVTSFNNNLQHQLEQQVVELNKNDKAGIEKQFTVPVSSIKKIGLFFPAMLAWLLHFPLYFPVKKYLQTKMPGSDHYDSVLIGILFLSYPIYLLLLFFILFLLTHNWWSLSCFIVLPFTAWCYLQLKKQV